MLTQKKLLSAVVIDNYFKILDKINSNWITNGDIKELLRHALSVKIEGALTIETLRTYLHDPKLLKKEKYLSLLTEIETGMIYKYDEIISDLEREYTEYLSNRLKEHSKRKDATADSVIDLARETVHLISQNTQEQYCHNIDDKINALRENIASGKRDEFAESIIKPEGIWSSIFSRAIYPFIYVLMTRPGGGKTAFSLNLMRYLSSIGKKCIFFALSDDTSETLTAKYIGVCSGVAINKIINYELDDIEKDMLGRYVNPATKRNIKIIDKPSLSGHKIINTIENILVDEKYDCVFIDYIQRIGYEMKQTRKETIDRFMQGMSAITKTHKLSTFILSQVSRQKDEKDGSIDLMLSDAKETGNIEEDARAVLAINYFDKKSGERELEWLKTTNFPFFKTKVEFNWASGKML